MVANDVTSRPDHEAGTLPLSRRPILVDGGFTVMPLIFRVQFKTSFLRVLQAIPSPLLVVYSIKIVQEEQN
jgi:hypothetical protein